MLRYRWRSRKSFNEATPFQAWRQSYSYAPLMNGCLLQRSHALSGVETEQESCRRLTLSSFNEATPFQAWRPPEERKSVSREPYLQRSHALSGVETV